LPQDAADQGDGGRDVLPAGSWASLQADHVPEQFVDVVPTATEIATAGTDDEPL
jgi:hypothetical protein